MDGVTDSAPLPRQDCWDQVSEWISDMGSTSFAALVNNLPQSKDYKEWLKEQVQDRDAASDVEKSEFLKLSHLPASCKIDCGCRAVSLKSLTTVARNLVIQGAWREYDTAQLCYLDGVGDENLPPLFYVKFHHRAAAMLLLMFHFFVTEKPMPVFLSTMATSIKLKFHGALAHGLTWYSRQWRPVMKGLGRSCKAGSWLCAQSTRIK